MPKSVRNNSPTTKHNSGNMVLGMNLAIELAVYIAVPALIFIFIGRRFDVLYQTSPVFIILGLVIAFFVSSLAIYYKAMKIYRDLEIDYLSSMHKHRTTKQKKQSKKVKLKS